MSYEKNELKFVNFKFSSESILIQKTNKKKLKSKEHHNVHISGIKVISELEALLFFTYTVNYSNIINISMNGSCNIISFGSKANLINQIITSNKNSELFKKNKQLLITIKDKIKKGCFNNVKRIAEENGINFITEKIPKEIKKEFKDVVFLDGDEDLI